MSHLDARVAWWFGQVIDLLGEPLTELPVEWLLDHLVHAFPTTSACLYWAEADGSFGMTIVPDGILLTERETFDLWLSGEFFDCHALMTWFAVTGDLRPQTLGRVPSGLVPAHRRMIIEEPLARLQLEQQLSIVYRRDAASEHAVVLGRGGRDFSDEDLELAVAVQRGLRSLDAQINVLQGMGATGVSAIEAGLTPRECAVLQLISDGQSVRVAARRLGCSPRTVEKHLQHSYRKLGVRDRLNAVRLVHQLSLLPAPEPPVPPTAAGLTNYRGPLVPSA